MDVVQRLSVLIGVPGAAAVVTDMQKVAKSFETEAVSADKASLALAKQTAAVDKLAASEAKLALAQAKASGGGGLGSAEATAASAAQQQYAVSKSASAVAADKLAVSEANAANAAKGLGTAASGSTNKLAQFGVAGASTGEAIAGIASKAGPALLVLGSLKVLSDGVKNFEALTGQVRAFQNVSGASARDASLLVGQINTLGIDSDLVGKAIFRLGSSIGDGTTKLGQYGIVVAKNKDGSNDLVGTFDNVRRAFAASTDATERDAIAKAAYSRGGAALLPLLRLTTDEINRMNAATVARGGVFSQSDVNSGYALKVASAEMSQSIKGFEATLASGVVPALSEAAGLASRIVNALNQANKWSGGNLFGGVIPDLLKGLGITHDQSKANAAAAVSADASMKSVENLTKATIGQFDAIKANDAATRSYNSAVLSQTKSQEALAKIVKAGAVDMKAVASAQKEVTAASRAYDQAVDAQTKAQDALAKATKGATAEEMAQAQLNVAEGPNKLAAAQAAVNAAQEKFDALQGAGKTSAAELALASAAVETAKFGVTQQTIDQAKAEDALIVVKQKGTKADPAVISAQEALANAHDGVASALDREKTASDNLRTARAGDPAFAQRLADAQDAVKVASQGVKDAEENQQSTAYKLRQSTDAFTGSLSANAGAIGDVANALQAFPGYEAIIAGPAAAAAQIALLNAQAAALLNNPIYDAQQAGRAAIHGYASGPPPALPPSVSTARGGTPHRAGGGPVDPGGTYLINENGAEYLKLGNNTSGYVTPHGMTPAGGGGGTVINLYTTVNNSNASADEIARAQGWMLRTVTLPTATRSHAA